jgi:hypothetical protein
LLLKLAISIALALIRIVLIIIISQISKTVSRLRDCMTVFMTRASITKLTQRDVGRLFVSSGFFATRKIADLSTSATTMGGLNCANPGGRKGASVRVRGLSKGLGIR